MNRCCLRLAILLVFTLLATACQREEPPPVSAIKPQAPTAAVDEAPPAPAPATPAPSVAPETTRVAVAAAPTAAGAPVIFMAQGTVLRRGETLAEALPVWRRSAAQPAEAGRAADRAH